MNALATGRREDDSHTATLLPQCEYLCLELSLALLPEVVWSRGEERPRPGAQITFQQTSPTGPGSAEMLGVKRNNHYFFFFI